MCVILCVCVCVWYRGSGVARIFHSDTTPMGEVNCGHALVVRARFPDLT